MSVFFLWNLQFQLIISCSFTGWHAYTQSSVSAFFKLCSILLGWSTLCWPAQCCVDLLNTFLTCSTLCWPAWHFVGLLDTMPAHSRRALSQPFICHTLASISRWMQPGTGYWPGAHLAAAMAGTWSTTLNGCWHVSQRLLWLLLLSKLWRMRWLASEAAKLSLAVGAGKSSGTRWTPWNPGPSAWRCSGRLPWPWRRRVARTVGVP